MARWYRETSAPGIDWNMQGQIELAHVLHSYVPEVSLLPSYEQVAREGYGQGTALSRHKYFMRWYDISRPQR
jgi:hypothetical protein